MSLVNSAGSVEILLMRQEQSVLDCNIQIGDVIEDGTDEQFTEMKAFLMKPENNVVDTCLRLSGVRNMIMEIADLSPDSPVRQYLSKAISQRVREVLGDKIQLGNENMPDKTKIFNGYPQNGIVNVFGIQIRFRPAEECDWWPITG